MSIIGIEKTEAADGASFVFDISPNAQEVGDVIFVSLMNDSGNNVIDIAGWTPIAGIAPNNFSRCACFYIEHTGSDIFSATATGTSNDWSAIAITMRGIDLADVVNVSARSDFGSSVYEFPAPAITTTRDNTLLFRVYGLDGGTIASPTHGYGLPEAGRVERINNTSHYVDYELVGDTGSVESLAYNTGSAVAGTARYGTTYTIAFSMETAADLQPCVNSKPDIIADYSAPPTTFDITTLHATLLGKTTSNVSINSVSRLTSYGPDLSWHGGYTQYFVSTPNSLSVQLLCKTVTSTDMSVYPYSITFGNSQTFRYSDGGALFYFRDSAGNWALWQPLTKEQFGNGTLRTIIAKMPDQTFVDSGGIIDWSDIVVTGQGQDVVSTSVSTQRWNVACEAVMTPALITGGMASSPTSPKLIADSFGSGVSIYRSSSQGIGQDLIATSVELGDLVTKTHFIGSLDSTSYPANNSDSLLGYKCEAGSHSFLIKASDEDTLDFRSWILRSPDKQDFIVDPLSSISATYLTNSWIVSGYDVTWKTGVSCNGANFVVCGVIDIKGAEFLNGTVSDSISTTHAMTASDGASVGYDFEKGSETYAIELSSVGGTYDLTGSTFSGYTTILNVTAATGTTTITLAEGQTVPSYDTAGATVVFVFPILLSDVSVTNIVVGSRLRILNVTTGSEILNTVVTSSDYSDTYIEGTTYTTGDLVEVTITYQAGLVAKLGFKQSVIVGSNGWSVLAEQQDDTVYTLNNIDGSTVTNFTADYVNDEIDIITAVDYEGIALYARYVFFTTTEDGIRDFFGGIVAMDAANYYNDINIVNLFLNNNTSTNLKQTDNVRYYKSDGSYPVKNPTTGGGGIDIVWRDRVYVAETGISGLTPTESAQLQYLIDNYDNPTYFFGEDGTTRVEQPDCFYISLRSLDSLTEIKRISTVDSDNNPIRLADSTGYILA